MTGSFLFVVWAGGGNVPPQLALARRLAARGHAVRMLAPAVLREAIEAAGVTFEPYRAAPEHDSAVPERSLAPDFEHRSPMAAAKVIRERLFVGMAEPIASDVASILERERIDVVAPDFMMLGALFAAEKAGVRHAMLIHTIYPFPRPGVPPYGMGWKPMAGPVGTLRDLVGRALFMQAWARPMLPGLNKARAQMGLPRLRSLLDLAAPPNPVLVLASRAFDYPGQLPANVRYLGTQIDDGSESDDWTTPWPATDTRPLVVVSFSTTYQAHEDVIRRAVEAVGRLDVRAVVSTGPVSLGDVPRNVHAARFVPHARLFPGADAVVTHAGLGTVTRALSHGVPLVCLPVGRDQPDNAARVEWHGAGLRLSTSSGADAIAAAVGRTLREPGFRAAAGRIAAAMSDEDPASRGPAELERLLPEGSVSSTRSAAA